MSRKSKHINSKSKTKDSLTYSIRKLFEKNFGKELTHQEVCSSLSVRENELRKQVYDALRYLCTSNFLKEKTHGVFMLNKEVVTLEGELQITARGAGFLLTGNKATDVFIAPQNLGQAMNGDLVRVILSKDGGGRREGIVIELLHRERTQFVGTILMKENFAYLIPDANGKSSCNPL